MKKTPDDEIGAPKLRDVIEASLSRACEEAKVQVSDAEWETICVRFGSEFQRRQARADE